MKMPKQPYAAEFEELTVKRVKYWQCVGMVVWELGLSDELCATGSTQQ